jgi:hypothetical protein
MKSLLGLTLAAAAGVSLATPAGAVPIRVRGTVAAVTSSTLLVRTAQGNVPVSFKGNTAFVSVVPSDLNHVRPGGYVGVASKNAGDRLIALSVIVFPPSMKGAAEGHAAYDILPDTTLSGGARTASSMTNASVRTIGNQAAPQANSSMTNGSVAAAVASGGVKLLTVIYRGGRQNILVPPTAPIVAFVPARASIVTSGASVFVNADKANGKITAALVAVGRNGHNPPF